jgi:hypothetical protein
MAGEKNPDLFPFMPVRIADAILSIVLNLVTFILGLFQLCKLFPHLEPIGKSMNIAVVSNSFLKLSEGILFV